MLSNRTLLFQTVDLLVLVPFFGLLTFCFGATRANFLVVKAEASGFGAVSCALKIGDRKIVTAKSARVVFHPA